MIILKSIKSKIIFYITLSTIVIGIISNLFIYTFSNKIIMDKLANINSLTLKNITTQLDNNHSAAYDLILLAANNFRVENILQYSSMSSPKIKSECLAVQEILTSYVRASSINKYVSKFLIFNTDGLILQAVSSNPGNANDLDKIINSALFQEFLSSTSTISNQFLPSIDNARQLCLASLYTINNINGSDKSGYLYVEFDLKLLTDILDIYQKSNNLFLVANQGQLIPSNTSLEVPPDLIINHLQDKAVSFLNYDDDSYLISSNPIGTSGYKLYNFTKTSNLYLEKTKLLFMISLVILTSIILSILLLIIISTHITSPINKLIKKLEHISYKDFSFDSEIQNFTGEMGQIGKVVNNLCIDIQNLLDETIKITNEKKNYEIAMLQSQVNPHFLYNTLNSIHWMATLQKNIGICNMTQALTHLLKNMSKGISDKITLSEEISLLEDYLYIQSIRYIDTFEFINHIPSDLLNCYIIKLTLQPLIENAIFHGIEPKGALGLITLDAVVSNNTLTLIVGDNGIGMSKETIHMLLSPSQNTSKSSLSGIGVHNVDSRLKLIYGSHYGLDIESLEGEYTKIYINIPLEREGKDYV